MKTTFKKTFKTTSFKRAVSAIYSNLDDRDLCELSWREYVEDEIKIRKVVMRIWSAKNLLADLNRYSFISLAL